MDLLRLQVQSINYIKRKHHHILVFFLVCLALSVQSRLHAADANGLGPTFKTGHVFARGILLGENGQPIFAEYNEQGQVIQQYGEAVGELEGARVISADDYLFQHNRYLDFLSEFGRTKAKAARILTRQEYLGTSFGTATLPDLNGEAGDTVEVNIVRTPLDAEVQSVLVRDNATIVTRGIAESDLVLFSSTIDLRDAIEQLGEDNAFPDPSTRSLLLNNSGQLLHRSTVDIGLRTAFWNRQDGSQLSNAELDGRNGHGAGDTPIAPIAEALVYPDMQWNATGRTDENGQFSLYYFLPPCPGFSWFYDYNLIAEIPYRNFNPKSRAWQQWSVYYTTVPVGDRCDGTALNLSTATDLTGQSVYNTLVGINASSPQPIVRADMPIVANMLTGVGMLTNDGETPVDLGERTEYGVDKQFANIPALPENLDLDANEVPDDVRIGEDGKVQVRFDENSEDADFTRVVDTLPDFSDQGLLKTLNPEDLSDTDLYVYRQSTGQLLVDREGLKQEEYGIYNLICAETDPDCLAEGQEPTNSFFYQMLIRGRWYYDYLAGALPDYQSKTRINEDLRGLDSNHLRAGEEIKLVAINRKTGYIGTAVAKVKAGGAENNALSFEIPPLMLQPPNLKIEAKRTLDIEAGLTRGEEREYTIGSEGAGLTSDKTVVVTTEWVDQDGSPLPDDLPGYTGRLAQIIDTNELGTPTSELSNFAIRPGRRTQIIRLTENDVLGREHFYIHVSGEPVDGNPSFARTRGAGEGLLQFRPDYYVPIRVPVFDEAATRKARNELRYAQKEELTDLELDDIDAIYQWPHRPEMQFSVFDLDVNKIAGIDESTSDVHPDVQTIIYDPNSLEDCERDPETLLQCFLNNADVVTFEYALFGDPNDPLPVIGPDRTLILSLGGEEVVIGPQYGADQTVRFEDPEHLRQLDTEDYLTIALYQNNDAENLLWEFDLVKAALVVDANRDGFIQADEPEDSVALSEDDAENNSQHLINLVSSAVAQTNIPVSDVFGPSRDVNSRENPWRWWFNDDDDRGEVSGEIEGKGDSGDRPVSIPPGGSASYDIQQGAQDDPLDPGNTIAGNRFVADYVDNKVDGMRDLVDFFPVYLDIKQALNHFPPEQYSYRLIHRQSALRYVETSLKPKTPANERLLSAEELSDAYLQTSGDVVKNLAKANTIRITDEGVNLSSDFLRRIREDDEGVILVEAVNNGFDYMPRTLGGDCEDIRDAAICEPLELEILSKSNNLDKKSINGRSKLFLKIRGVEEMFRHINLRDKIPEKLETVPSRTMEPDNNPDTMENDNYLVWVHGYNVKEPSVRGWHSEAFKRFYQIGMKTRFIGVTWAGDTGSLQFARATFNGLRMGEELAKELKKEVPLGKKLSIIAHSAGNLVVSEAIQRYELQPDKYFGLDVAVPVEAYNSLQTVGKNSEDMKERMTPVSQKPYANVLNQVNGADNEVLFATNWYKNFQPQDPRSKLTWRGYFSEVPINTSMFNFFSSGEDVLESAFPSESFLRNLTELISQGGLSEGRHAWTSAHISMGCPNLATKAIYLAPKVVPTIVTDGGITLNIEKSIAGNLGTYCMGGWTFNDNPVDLEEIGTFDSVNSGDVDLAYRVSTPSEALSDYSGGRLTDEELTEIGFFKRFRPELRGLYAPAQGMASPFDRPFDIAIDLASSADVQRLMLSYAIPASSYPAGSNPIQILAGPTVTNIDMNDFQSAWPSFRNDDFDRNNTPDWKHSDIRVVAPQYTLKIFEKVREEHEK